MITQGGNHRQILLVDDDRNVSQVLKFLLETKGYVVRVASSGKEALQGAVERTDLILLDLVLPDLDGFDICRQLKDNAGTKSIPIIILSARHRFADKVEGLDLGADDYLTKPFEHEELFARIEAVLRRTRQVDVEAYPLGDDNLAAEVRKIIDEERVVPYFQPIYTFTPVKLLGLEVLTRPKVEGPLANPEVLFKVALKHGLYYELELLCWRKALECAKVYLPDQTLFFNCSPDLIEGPRFLMIKTIFDQSSFSSKNIVLEITERSKIKNYKTFYNHLKVCRENGFRFAVDDVGGGFASLESIVETKPEMVKIDRHIISEIQVDQYKLSIVKFIVSFCKENNITSIAEGIETKDQLRTLFELGVSAGQGYYLHEPKPKIYLENICQNINV